MRLLFGNQRPIFFDRQEEYFFHPHYEIEKTYSFKYLRTVKDFDPLGKEENVIIVEDIFGVETKVIYELFPDGPVKKASRIAGYLKPASCV